jgi:hypothetical protein
MESNDILSKAVSAIHVGGKETLRKPPVFSCSEQTHEPFRLMETPIEFENEEEGFLWGAVRTSGWQFDGDRSDIHDVFSLVWAALLRAFGLSSPWLIDEPHVVVPGELGARHLVLQQCPWSLSRDADFADTRKSMNAWTAFGFHLLDDVFSWGRCKNHRRPSLPPLSDESSPAWADAVLRFLRQPRDVILSYRKYPLWIYFASYERGITIVRMPRIRLMALKSILTPFQASKARGEDALALFANGIPNAVPYTVIRKAQRILSITGDGNKDPFILPIDSHCLFVGDKTVIAIRENCGKELFESEREFLLKRRASENLVFFADSAVKWKDPISAEDFEGICLDLLRREPGIIRAKAVGGINDRDGGRDILIDWSAPLSHENSSVNISPSPNHEGIHAGGVRPLRVIAQVKSRSKTLGKRDVQDIRDTIEHYEADAYLLIAYPKISSALVDYLESLRRRTCFRTEWWEASDIESRLRRHPDVAVRYPNLLELRSGLESSI